MSPTIRLVPPTDDRHGNPVFAPPHIKSKRWHSKLKTDTIRETMNHETFAKLPNEIYAVIFTFLRMPELIRIERVSKRFQVNCRGHTTISKINNFQSVAEMIGEENETSPWPIRRARWFRTLRWVLRGGQGEHLHTLYVPDEIYDDEPRTVQEASLLLLLRRFKVHLTSLRLPPHAATGSYCVTDIAREHQRLQHLSLSFAEGRCTHTSYLSRLILPNLIHLDLTAKPLVKHPFHSLSSILELIIIFAPQLHSLLLDGFLLNNYVRSQMHDFCQKISFAAPKLVCRSLKLVHVQNSPEKCFGLFLSTSQTNPTRRYSNLLMNFTSVDSPSLIWAQLEPHLYD